MRLIGSVALCLGLALQLPVPVASETSGPTVLALTGAHLIDGTGAAAVEDGVVVIRGDRILYAGPAQSSDIPANAFVIHLDGRTVLPGFINSHVHLGANIWYLQEWARGGVTTVRDLGYATDRLARFRENYRPSPYRARLVAAGPLITVPGGYPIVPFGGAWALAVHSIADARQQAEALLDGPADILKITFEEAGGQLPTLSNAEAQAIVQVAHDRGTVVSAHVAAPSDVTLALNAGVDDLAHMAWREILPSTVAQRVVRNGVYWVPTLELWACVDSPWIAINNLRRFVNAGGFVALGTDFAGYTCDWELGMPMTEIRYMRQAGMMPMQIIVSATRNGAKVCNLEHEIGTLEAGKMADLIVVDGDPIADLEALSSVVMVIHGGHVIRNDMIATDPQPFEPRHLGHVSEPLPR
ncbi:MAG: amidohydrolase family protein [bacterium]|nr:amidohydrolase family protein [bacterium]